MTKKTNRPLVLICTGLGRVNRGFEMYISSLAENLSNIGLNTPLEIWTGGSWNKPGIKSRRIKSIGRNSFFVNRLGNAFTWEQRTFTIGMLRQLLITKPAAIYLGEYQLYCYLFKLRQLLGLQYSLVLYTGGQAIPGLFNHTLDYVHHVTDRYLPECRHIPVERQFLLPHFIENDFEYDQQQIQSVKQKAAGKKIVLSVGLLDKAVKRMDLLVQSLIPLRESVFPILLGDENSDTPFIRNLLDEHFGNGQYILGKVPHNALGNYYAAADRFVLCSPKESFGLAYVEALWHGLPVICDDFKESRYVLKDKARFINMCDENALTEAIKAEWENGIDEIAKAERIHFATKNYSWNNLAGAYKNMFTQILQN